MPSEPYQDRVVTTRRSLHAVAEQVLATALHEATGRIGLRVVPGGFATPLVERSAGWTQLVVDGIELVVRSDHGESRSPITAIAAAARAVGVERPGMSPEVYTPATHVAADEPLVLDEPSAIALATIFAVGAAALDRLRLEWAGDDTPIVQLWPEHFDAATTVSEVNYGVSPGDDNHPLPYLYVGPWDLPRPDGGFWNEPFGASRTVDAGLTVDDAITFFREGRHRTKSLPAR